MKTVIQIVGKTAAAFGFVSASMTLFYALWLQESLRSDDPYVMGWAAGIMTLPAFVLFLIVEHFWGRRASTWVYAVCFLLLSAFLLLGVFYGELHGAGLALILLVGTAIYAPTVFLLLRATSIRWLLPAGWVIAILFLVGLGVTYYVRA
jgi:hypothetical protein